MLELILSALALCSSLAAVLVAVQAFREVRASAPKQVMDGFQDVRDRVQAAEENVGLFRGSLIAWEAQMGGVLESVEDALSRIDRKRRSTAAAASKIEQKEREANGGDPNSMTDAQLLQRARELGAW